MRTIHPYLQSNIHANEVFEYRLLFELHVSFSISSDQVDLKGCTPSEYVDPRRQDGVLSVTRQEWSHGGRCTLPDDRHTSSACSVLW